MNMSKYITTTTQLPGRGAVTTRIHEGHLPDSRDTMSTVDIITESYGEEGVFYPAQHIGLFGKSARALFDALKAHFEPREHDK